jgi:predicted peptidase
MASTHAATSQPDPDAPLPTMPGDYKLLFRAQVGERTMELPYLLHLPNDYTDAKKKHPMLVFFHGMGECGTDLARIYAAGPMTQFKAGGRLARSCPFIVLCPQCPPRGQRWETPRMYQTCIALVKQTIGKIRVDPDRVYATGLSMGGDGTWDVTIQSPGLFAAIAPLSAMACRVDVAAKKLNYVSVWSVAGVEDESRFIDGARQMEAALKNNPRDNRFTYLLKVGHGTWDYAYDSTTFYEWLLAHRRPTAAERHRLDAQHHAPATQPIPNQPGHYLLTFDTTIGDQPFQMDYLLYLPKGYNPAGPARPAMLFLHDLDTIGPDIHGLCPHGPDLQLERKDGHFRDSFPFVVISPRPPIKCDWNTPGMNQALVELLDHVGQSVRIDQNRICATGVNAGGTAAWDLAARYPDRFAAVAPVMTDGDFAPSAASPPLMKNIPAWFVVKASDPINRLKSLIVDTKNDWRISTLSPAITPLDLPTYADGAFLHWIEQQRRPAMPTTTASK